MTWVALVILVLVAVDYCEGQAYVGVRVRDDGDCPEGFGFKMNCLGEFGCFGASMEDECCECVADTCYACAPSSPRSPGLRPRPQSSPYAKRIGMIVALSLCVGFPALVGLVIGFVACIVCCHERRKKNKKKKQLKQAQSVNVSVPMTSPPMAVNEMEMNIQKSPSSPSDDSNSPSQSSKSPTNSKASKSYPIRPKTRNRRPNGKSDGSESSSSSSDIQTTLSESPSTSSLGQSSSSPQQPQYNMTGAGAGAGYNQASSSYNNQATSQGHLY